MEITIATITATIAVLDATGKLLSILNKHVMQPNKTDQEKIKEQALRLESSYEAFQLISEAIKRELKSGDITKLRQGLSSIGNTVDNQFLEVLHTCKALLKNIMSSDVKNLLQEAYELQTMLQELFDNWKIFKEAVLTQKPRYFRKFTNQFLLKIDTTVKRTLSLSQKVVSYLEPIVERHFQKVFEKLRERARDQKSKEGEGRTIKIADYPLEETPKPFSNQNQLSDTSQQKTNNLPLHDRANYSNEKSHSKAIALPIPKPPKSKNA